MILEQLYNIILSRKEKMPKNSYVGSLFKEGNDWIIRKVGEEAIEVVIAAKNKNKEKIILEVADLWFHSLVLLASFSISPTEIFSELKKRFKNKIKSEK